MEIPTYPFVDGGIIQRVLESRVEVVSVQDIYHYQGSTIEPVLCIFLKHIHSTTETDNPSTKSYYIDTTSRICHKICT